MSIRTIIRVLGSILILVLGVPAFAAQISTQDLERIGGPWECIDLNGIHGIFVKVDVGEHAQLIQFQVYERISAKTSQIGWFVNKRSEGTSFDGKHLTIAFQRKDLPNIRAFDLDLTFDTSANQWSGSWTFCNPGNTSVLERPRPANGSMRDVLLGDWKQEPSRYGPQSTNILHVLQASDGQILTWSETKTKSGYASYLVQLSVTDRSIHIQEDSGSFRGTISESGTGINGEWQQELGAIGGDGGRRPLAYQKTP